MCGVYIKIFEIHSSRTSFWEMTIYSRALVSLLNTFDADT